MKPQLLQTYWLFHFLFLQLAINLLPYLQSAVNPIIYGFMSKNFRRSLLSAFRTRCNVDLVALCRRRKPAIAEYDMDTRSMTINGAGYSSRYSPSNTKAGRTIMTTIVSDIWNPLSICVHICVNINVRIQSIL